MNKTKIDKLAVIFCGIVGAMGGRNGLGAPINVESCAKTIKYNILSEYDTDVFIHSWSTEYKDSMVFLYDPVMSIFEPQEMFGYSFNAQTFKDESHTHSFRVVSRYTSLYRAMQLKQNYENKNNFKYDWVLVLRFDLVAFNKLNLSNLNNNNFYICSDPGWPDINSVQLLSDLVFLSGSELMDTYCNITNELNIAPYNSLIGEPHRLPYFKLKNMFQGDMNRIGYAFKRYEDIELYRLIMRPNLNEFGHQFGELETKHRLELLLKEINV